METSLNASSKSKQTHWPAWNTNCSRVTCFAVLTLQQKKNRHQNLAHLIEVFITKMMFSSVVSPSPQRLQAVLSYLVDHLAPVQHRESVIISESKNWIQKHVCGMYLSPNRSLRSGWPLLPRWTLKGVIKRKIISFECVNKEECDAGIQREKEVTISPRCPLSPFSPGRPGMPLERIHRIRGLEQLIQCSCRLLRKHHFKRSALL